MVQVIFHLVEFIKNRIAAELQGTRGALIYEGCSCNDLHYVAVIASYCVEVKIQEGSISHRENEQRLVLISLSPILSVNDDCQDYTVTMSNEASKFNAKAHVNSFRDICPLFGLEFDK